MDRARPHAAALRALPATTLLELPALERTVVCAYYGLDGEAQTLRMVARRLRMGEARVRALLAHALEVLVWAASAGG
jgi:DNA-directed RNA polymerase sigma subunit (sigma70/sigma32)